MKHILSPTPLPFILRPLISPSSSGHSMCIYRAVKYSPPHNPPTPTQEHPPSPPPHTHLDHGLEHLCGGDDGLPRVVALLDHHLLGKEDLLCVSGKKDFDCKVSATHCILLNTGTRRYLVVRVLYRKKAWDHHPPAGQGRSSLQATGCMQAKDAPLIACMGCCVLFPA